MKSTINNLIDKTLNIFFSKNKTSLYVLALFLAGFILRLINVLNFPTSVDSSGHALMAFNFIEAEKLVIWHQSAGLWYFLTDFAYKIFGISDFSARLVALIFGSFSIIMIFLLTKEFFNKKVGLIAAFLLAFSPFHITETIPEMDVAAMFFVMFSIYVFAKSLKNEKRPYFILSGILMGLAILMKVYSLLFIPALIIYSLYFQKKNNLRKKRFIKNITIFLLSIFVFCIISLTFNYLLYQDKGFVDHIFTSTFNIGKDKSDQYYSWIYPYTHDYLAFFIGNYNDSGELPFFIFYLKILFTFDKIMVLFGVIGLSWILLKRNYKNYLVLLLGMFFTIYLYLGSIPYLMQKHYMFLLIFLAPLAAFSLYKIGKKIDIRILIIIILVFQLYSITTISSEYYHKSPMNQLVSYKSKNIPDEAIVVYDARIFRGQGTYIFMDKHYLESSLFPQVINSQETLPGENIPIETYFIECVKDDCGWGTIKDQPEFNKSMEDIVDFFKNNSRVDKEIFDNANLEEYRIYKTTFNLKQSTIQAIDSTHIFWANPVGYDEEITPIFDKYETHTAFERFLDKLAHYILYLSAVLSIISIFILLYIFINENEEIEYNHPSIQ